VSLIDGNRECGIRHKFAVRHRDHAPTAYPVEMERLLHWCAVFDQEGLAPLEGGASAGNLSFRTPAGFVITPTRSRLKAGLDWRHLVEVVRAEWGPYTLHVLGDRAPSSDSFLHERIYSHRPDVLAVFHGHDEAVLRHADRLAREFPIAVTAESRLFGTRGDAEETARELAGLSYIIRKGHGFVSVGRSLDAAGEQAVRIHRRAVELG
jgi:ribulose-5-phosphate 4-epimerase/fuculose-1-phosphate aldolase